MVTYICKIQDSQVPVVVFSPMIQEIQDPAENFLPKVQDPQDPVAMLPAQDPISPGSLPRVKCKIQNPTLHQSWILLDPGKRSWISDLFYMYVT